MSMYILQSVFTIKYKYFSFINISKSFHGRNLEKRKERKKNTTWLNGKEKKKKKIAHFIILNPLEVWKSIQPIKTPIFYFKMIHSVLKNMNIVMLSITCSFLKSSVQKYNFLQNPVKDIKSDKF